MPQDYQNAAYYGHVDAMVPDPVYAHPDNLPSKGTFVINQTIIDPSKIHDNRPRGGVSVASISKRNSGVTSTTGFGTVSAIGLYQPENPTDRTEDDESSPSSQSCQNSAPPYPQGTPAANYCQTQSSRWQEWRIGKGYGKESEGLFDDGRGGMEC